LIVIVVEEVGRVVIVEVVVGVGICHALIADWG
jgi:hypothetical protein